MAVLVVLGGCSAEATAQTPEAPTTTQVIVPKISPEEARQIIAEIIVPRYDLGATKDAIIDYRYNLNEYETLDIFVDELPGSGANPRVGYYEVRVLHFNGYKTQSYPDLYYVDCITGEPFDGGVYGKDELQPLTPTP